MNDQITRSVTIDTLPTDGQRRAIIDSVRRYRAACRQLYSALLLSQTAGARVGEWSATGGQAG